MFRAFKVIKTSFFEAQFKTGSLMIGVSEIGFQAHQKPTARNHREASMISSIQRSWKNSEKGWTGYLCSGKQDGALVYSGVPYEPIYYETEHGSIPGLEPGGPTRLIGFLKQHGSYGVKWSVVTEYDLPLIREKKMYEQLSVDSLGNLSRYQMALEG